MAYPANGLAIIALNSAMPNTTSRQSAGGLTEETLQWAEQAAAQAHSDGRAVIGVMHHNIVEHFDGHARFASTYIANTSASLPALEEVQQRLVAAKACRRRLQSDADRSLPHTIHSARHH